MHSNGNTRPGRGEFYVKLAETYATRGTCPRAHVGCVVIRNKRVISAGYNGAPPGLPHCGEVGCRGTLIPEGQGCTRAVHAEANAIAWAARDGLRLLGGVMYCTHEPCMPCSQLIISAGIQAVYWVNDYPRNSGTALLREARLEIIGRP